MDQASGGMEDGLSNKTVRLAGVSKTYETQAARIVALEKMNWSIGGGEAAALMGPSGCGKTTILNLLGGMDRPSEGEIWVNGENVAAMTERQLEVYRLRKVGFVFQFFNLIPSLSAIENLELPMLLAGVGAEERRARAESLLDTVGLKAKGFKRPEELSGGEQQRVAVCLALVNDPPIILADEPTGNLDCTMRRSSRRCSSTLRRAAARPSSSPRMIPRSSSNSRASTTCATAPFSR